jgi:hypothetical protein
MMKKFALTLSILLLPFVAHAQFDNLSNLLDSFGGLIDVATPIVVGLALLAFFWGLAKYIFSAGNEEAKESGKNIMIWGIIALFVMVSVWGIVRFIGSALGIQEGGTVDVPTVL